MNRIVLPLLVASLAGCDLSLPCTNGEWRCNAGTLEQCVAHPAGFTGGGIGDIHHQASSPNTWDVAAECGSGLCIAPDAGTPFCALEADADPSCAGASPLLCEGTTAVQCKSGHVFERTACGSCDISPTTSCDPFLDGTCCSGHQGATCQVDGDCAQGMTCVPGGSSRVCEMACTCAEGAACPTCNVLWDRSAYPDGAPSVWVCESSLCALKFQ